MELMPPAMQRSAEFISPSTRGLKFALQDTFVFATCADAVSSKLCRTIRSQKIAIEEQGKDKLRGSRIVSHYE
jgi:hypothetical protein